MKVPYAAIAIVIAAIISVIFFDQIVVFLLSGFIPGLSITIPATTMLAVMVAGATLIVTLRYRHIVYQHCLTLYDAIFEPKKKNNSAPESSTKPKLPRRRYQEL